MFSKIRLLLCVALFSCLCQLVTAYWDNDYEQPLNVVCPPGQAVHRLRTEHNGQNKDRRWRFYCTPREELESGTLNVWFRSVNKYENGLDFTCPSGSVITGVKSVFDGYDSDRVWDYRCSSVVTAQCEHTELAATEYIVDYNAEGDWQTEKYIVGFQSDYSSQHQDRRWKASYAGLNCAACSCPAVVGTGWEVTNVTYNLDNYAINESEITIATQLFENECNQASMQGTFEVSETVEESFFFSQSKGVKLEEGMKFIILRETGGRRSDTKEGRFIDVTTGKSLEHTAGRTLTVGRTVSTSFVTDVPNNAHVTVNAVITRNVVSGVPYTMTIQHRDTGCQCTSSGTWNGVEHNHLRVVMDDVKSGGSSSASGGSSSRESSAASE